MSDIWDRDHFCKAEGCFNNRLRNGLCSEHAINQLLEDTTWEKHMSAEEPGELYWNEVTGIGSMHDQYKIAELEAKLTERCNREGHLSQFCESDGTPCVGEHDETTVELCFWCRTSM
jgi:hypothetical protein